MNLLPVVERELRVASRRSATYWGRVAAALVAIGAGAWILWTLASFGNMHAFGGGLFGMIGFLIFLYAMSAGITHSADSVVQEKQDGTLGLLFLTDLKGWEVVGGKLTASSLAATYRLVAALPILTVAILLGGVTWGEYWRMASALCATLFMSVSIGMYASTVARTPRGAGILTFTLLLALSIVNPIVQWVASDVLHTDWPSWLSLLQPWYLLVGGWDLEYRAQLMPAVHLPGNAIQGPLTNGFFFWSALVGVTLIGLFALALASYRLPRSWQDADSQRSPSRWRALADSLWFSGAQGRAQFRRSHLDRNPILWLSSRATLKPLFLWIFLISAALIFLGLGVWVGRTWWDSSVYLAASLLLHFSIKIWAASEAPVRFREDRRTGALELYLCTPLPVKEILNGQFLALTHIFLAPVGVLLSIDVLFILASDARYEPERVSWLLFWLVRMLFLVFDIFTMGWVGIWLAMKSRTQKTGALPILARVLGIPWGATIVLLTALFTLQLFSQAVTIFSEPGPFLGLWFFIGMINNGYWIWRCRGDATRNFRELATVQRKTQRAGFFKKATPAT